MRVSIVLEVLSEGFNGSEDCDSLDGLERRCHDLVIN